MKILVATDCYVYNLGGITASTLALCSGLRHHGHEVKTLSTAHGNRSIRDGDDYFIRSFPAFYYPGMRISFAVRDPLLRELEAWEPDIVHAQTEGSARRFSLRIVRHCRVPLIMTCHTDYGHFVFGKARSLPPVRALMCAVGYGLFRHAARLTVPSQKAAEFPFLQALACGLPFLCREDDALQGVLEHGENGLIYHSRQQYLDFASKLLREDELRRVMGSRSLQKAEGFSSDTYASSMIEVYEDALRENALSASDKKAAGRRKEKP